MRGSHITERQDIFALQPYSHVVEALHRLDSEHLMDHALHLEKPCMKIRFDKGQSTGMLQFLKLAIGKHAGSFTRCSQSQQRSLICHICHGMGSQRHQDKKPLPT